MIDMSPFRRRVHQYEYSHLGCSEKETAVENKLRATYLNWHDFRVVCLEQFERVMHRYEKWRI